MSDVCSYCGWCEESGLAHDCRSELQKEIERLRAKIAELEEQLVSAIEDIECYEAMRDGFTQRATDMELEDERLRRKIAELECRRSETVAMCDQLLRDLDEAREAARWYYQDAIIHGPLESDEANLERWPWLDHSGDEWRNDKPPNETIVEVECDGQIIEVMAYYGRDGSLPCWRTKDGTHYWGVSKFTRWRLKKCGDANKTIGDE